MCSPAKVDSDFRDILYADLLPRLPVRLKIVATDPSNGAKGKAGDYCAGLLMLAP